MGTGVVLSEANDLTPMVATVALRLASGRDPSVAALPQDDSGVTPRSIRPPLSRLLRPFSLFPLPTSLFPFHFLLLTPLPALPHLEHHVDRGARRNEVLGHPEPP